MPRLTTVKRRADKRVMWIVGWDDADSIFPNLLVFPEENPDAHVSCGPVTRVTYNRDGTIKFIEDADTIYKFKPRPRGRPRRQDF